MLLSERRPNVDQNNLHHALRKLHRARELLVRLLSDEDAPTSERDGLKAAAEELERAIAIAESYI